LAVVVLLLLVVAVVAALLLRLRGVPRRRAMPALAAALGVYGLFFLLSAFALGIVAQAGLQLDGPGFRALLAATTISWALGFLVPGAPAGLGVRETVLILL